MWSILDHLTALLVVAVVILLLLTSQRDGQEASRDSMVRATSRGLLNQTTDWIERDLANIGAGVPTNEPAILTFGWTPEQRTFTFLTIADTSAGATVETVRYELARASSAGDSAGIGLYHELRRYTLGEGGTVLSSWTAPSIRELSIALFDEEGQPLTDSLGNVRAVEVHLSMDPLLGETGPPLVWNRRFYPRNLMGRAADPGAGSPSQEGS
jgi:hypothetical protein